jgi:FtsZ-binding cell division protein ZapB
MEQKMSAKEIYQMELEELHQKIVDLTKRADEIRKALNELDDESLPLETFNILRNWYKTI